MKTEKGITITSLIIYVIAMTFVISIVTTISTYFYNNVLTVSNDSSVYKQYTKFNSYFIQEINTANNGIIKCEDNYIVFTNGNQYTIQNNSIYLNTIKICEGLEESKCQFSSIIDTATGKQLITVKLTEKKTNKEILTTYTIKDW